MVEVSKEALKWRAAIDMLEVKKKYGLYCSMDDDTSEASISIAYERLKNSFEDDSHTSVTTQKFKYMLSVKQKYNIFDDEVSEISASIAYQRMLNSRKFLPTINSPGKDTPQEGWQTLQSLFQQTHRAERDCGKFLCRA